MFENLSTRINTIFTNLRRRGKLTEQDVDAVLREVRLALLEADVHYSVVKDFINRIRTRAVGTEVSKALNPAQQVIKIVHEELVVTLGEPSPLHLTGTKPRVVLLAGLQGSGKTTLAAKIARQLRSQGERILLVAADPYRPAAVKQLQVLGERVDVPVYADDGVEPPLLCANAVAHAQRGGYSVVIVDSAGRSQLDSNLMEEIRLISERVKPVEVLLVVDSMIGQEALRIAQGFQQAIQLTGLVLTKMDGDARGGAAISIRQVTGIPIKYLSTGENVDAIEVYQPTRLASRILGMGDVIGLIEKAEDLYAQMDPSQQEARTAAGHFTLEDFANQLKQMRKMGPFSQILEMLPGSLGQAAKSVSPQDAEKQLKLTEAVIGSMTIMERRNPDVLNASRRRRIARGSGTSVEQVNRILRQFREAQKLMKTLQKTGGKGLSRLFG